MFVSVLQRLTRPGSDHACYTEWMKNHQIEGVEDFDLHHSYRAIGWLGEELDFYGQDDRTPLRRAAPRT